MGKKGIRAQSVQKQEARINANKNLLQDDNYVKFSYKYLDMQHEKFSIEEQTGEYFRKLIQRLKDLSGKTVNELRTPSYNSKTIRCHSICWDHVTEDCFGIPNEDEIVDEPYQFSVSSNEHGRVHGFFIGNIFYIRWFDPGHKLYA